MRRSLFRPSVASHDATVSPSTGPSVEIRRALQDHGLSLGNCLGRVPEQGPWRCVDTSGRDRVLRLLPAGQDRDGARTRRRASELLSLRHSALAPLHEVLALPQGKIGLVTAWVPGVSLSVVVGARGGLGRAESARLLDDLGSALAYMHEHGQCHGDVAPANVMISAEGGAVLVDLLSRVEETGTPGFAAPERLDGGPATPAADVYSLARVLQASAGSSVLLRARLDGVLGQALEQDPSRRPGARDLAARAHELASPAGIALPPASELAAGVLRAAASRPTSVVGSRTRRGSVVGRGEVVSGRKAEAMSRAAGRCESLEALGRSALSDGSWSPRRRVSGSLRKGRLARMLVASALIGVLSALGAVTWPRWVNQSPEQQIGTFAPTAEGRVTDSGQVDPQQAAVSLTLRRDQAIEAGDREALAATTLEGSPAAESDAALIDSMIASGEKVEGLTTSVSEVEEVPLPEGAGAWQDARAVALTLTQGPTVRILHDGSRSTVPVQQARRVVLVLVPDPWRVVEVYAAQ